MDQNKLNTLMILHVQATYMSNKEIQEVSKFVGSEANYQGKVYRVIPYSLNPDLSKEKNLFWSKDVESLNHYLKLTNLTEYYILEAEIKGLCVNGLYTLLNTKYFPDRYPRTNNHEKENEVLALSLNEIKIFKTITKKSKRAKAS